MFLRGQDTAFASCFHCLRGQDTAFALCVPTAFTAKTLPLLGCFPCLRGYDTAFVLRFDYLRGLNTACLCGPQIRARAAGSVRVGAADDPELAAAVEQAALRVEPDGMSSGTQNKGTSSYKTTGVVC